MTDIALKVDYDRLREIADLGIRRAVVFMGIGTNAAEANPPISHTLDGGFQFQVVPADVQDSTKKLFLTEFLSWTISNGLRDIVEHFSVFLASCYSIQYILSRGSVLRGEHDKAVKQFDRKGVADQLCILSSLLELENKFGLMFSSLNRARNIMAHRRGVVASVDVDEAIGRFVVTWRTMRASFEDGRDVSALLSLGAVPVEKGQRILIGAIDREKSFALGEQVLFTRHELSEICFGVTMATDYMQRALIDFGKSKGVIMEEKNV